MQYLIRDKSSLRSREVTIEDARGQRVFRAHGPTLRIRDELRLDDTWGNEQIVIKEPVLSDRKTFELYRGGLRCGVVSMVSTGNLLEGFDVTHTSAAPLHARGDLLGREFTLVGAGGDLGHVHRHKGNAIEVETAGGQDDVLLLAGRSEERRVGK